MLLSRLAMYVVIPGLLWSAACGTSSPSPVCSCPQSFSLVQVPVSQSATVTNVMATGPCSAVCQHTVSTGDAGTDERCDMVVVQPTATGDCHVEIDLMGGTAVVGTVTFSPRAGCCSSSFQGTQSGFTFPSADGG